MLQDSVGFDNLMHGKSPKGSQKQRSLEDFGKLQAIYLFHGGRRLTVLQLCLSNVCLRNTRSPNRRGQSGKADVVEWGDLLVRRLRQQQHFICRTRLLSHFL